MYISIHYIYKYKYKKRKRRVYIYIYIYIYISVYKYLYIQKTTQKLTKAFERFLRIPLQFRRSRFGLIIRKHKFRWK